MFCEKFVQRCRRTVEITCAPLGLAPYSRTTTMGERWCRCLYFHCRQITFCCLGIGCFIFKLLWWYFAACWVLLIYSESYYIVRAIMGSIWFWFSLLVVGIICPFLRFSFTSLASLFSMMLLKSFGCKKMVTSSCFPFSNIIVFSYSMLQQTYQLFTYDF